MEIDEEKLRPLYVSGILGDGSLGKYGSMAFSSVQKDYMEYKKELSGLELEVKTKMNLGFKKAEIHMISILANEYGKTFLDKTLEEVVNELDELSLVLWLYDDGSLHKKNLFYNINTHSFTYEQQRDILIPKLNEFGIYPKILEERKKDGRVFNYLYVPKYEGTVEINELLKKYPVEGYKYKTFDDPYIERYYKMKEKFKGCQICIQFLGRSLMNNPDFESLFETLEVNDKGFLYSKNKKDFKDKVPKRSIILR